MLYRYMHVPQENGTGGHADGGESRLQLDQGHSLFEEVLGNFETHPVYSSHNSPVPSNQQPKDSYHVILHKV